MSKVPVMYFRISHEIVAEFSTESQKVNSWSHILAVMEQNHLGRTPPKMIEKKKKRNSNLYCAYHRDIRYETEDCNDLKKETKNLIKHEHLRQFVRRDGDFNRSDSRCNNRRDQCREDRQKQKSNSWALGDHRESGRPSRDESPNYEPNIVRIINTIEGGPMGGDSQNSRKRTYRQTNLDLVEPSSMLS